MDRGSSRFHEPIARIEAMTRPLSREERIEKINQLLKECAPMTNKQRDLQNIDFAYGNLACSTNHKPRRAAFEKVAFDSGLTKEEFEAWAKDKEWWT